MGCLTTHVLDTTIGRPAPGMRVVLTDLGSGAVLGEFRTNDDGRLNTALLEGDALKPGRYEFLFMVGDYYRAKGMTGSGLNFLEDVPLRFGVADASQHYHVPLLVSPWSYSTYRGS